MARSQNHDKKTIKQLRKEQRKREVKQTRQRFKKEGIAMFGRMLTEEIKQRGVKKSLWIFFGNFLLYFTIFGGVAYVNNNIRYCEWHDRSGFIKEEGWFTDVARSYSLEMKEQYENWKHYGVLGVKIGDNDSGVIMINTQQTEQFPAEKLNCTYQPTKKWRELTT